MKTNEVYQPSDDSFALAHQVKRYAKGTVLDVGTGTGIQALEAASSGKVKKVFAVDINKKALEYCKKFSSRKKIKYLYSDLFSAVKNQKFDTIIFNPPYLPKDHKFIDIAIQGGKKGHELLGRFITEVSEYLTTDGIVLIVFSSLTNKTKVDEMIEKSLLEKEQLHETKLFYELLYVYKIKKNKLRKELEKIGVKEITYFSKGNHGIIYKGKFKEKEIAIKLKKNEELRRNILNEAKWLKILNKKEIGPRLVYSGEDFIIYEFAKGKTLDKWIEKAKTPEIKKVLKWMLDTARTLDKLGLTKEEMHRQWKHVIIGKKTTMLDFERMHRTDKPHNATQTCQFLINARKTLEKKKIKINMKQLIELARQYKNNPTDENYGILRKSI